MTENFKIVYSKTSLDGIGEIYTYIKDVLCEEGSARKTVQAIRMRIKSLENMPFRYPVLEIENLSRDDLRKTLVGNFLIIYTVDNVKKIVYIVNVVYASRDLVKLLG